MVRWAIVLLSLACFPAASGYELTPQAPQCYKNYIGPGSARDEESPLCAHADATHVGNCGAEQQGGSANTCQYYFNATLEKQALAAVFRDTHGSRWIRKDNWRSLDDDWKAAPSVCLWHGVECSGEIVVALTLEGNNLQGGVPWGEIFALKGLERLSLANNKLVKEMPPLPAHAFRLLTLLDLHNNRLHGSPPDLSSAPFLTHVDLSGNVLTGAFNVANLPPRAVHVRMRRNILSSILPAALPPPLVLLDLSANSISGPLPAALFPLPPHLHTLDLSSNLITSLPATLTPPAAAAAASALAGLLLGRNPLGNAAVQMLEGLWSNRGNLSFPAPRATSLVLDLAETCVRGSASDIVQPLFDSLSILSPGSASAPTTIDLRGTRVSGCDDMAAAAPTGVTLLCPDEASIAACSAKANAIDLVWIESFQEREGVAAPVIALEYPVRIRLSRLCLANVACEAHVTTLHSTQSSARPERDFVPISFEVVWGVAASGSKATQDVFMLVKKAAPTRFRAVSVEIRLSANVTAHSANVTVHPGKDRVEVRLDRCTQDGSSLGGTCLVEGVCGDGVRDPDEQCDDGDEDGGDGCSALCKVEPSWTCSFGSLSSGDTCTQNVYLLRATEAINSRQRLVWSSTGPYFPRRSSKNLIRYGCFEDPWHLPSPGVVTTLHAASVDDCGSYALDNGASGFCIGHGGRCHAMRDFFAVKASLLVSSDQCWGEDVGGNGAAQCYSVYVYGYTCSDSALEAEPCDTNARCWIGSGEDVRCTCNAGYTGGGETGDCKKIVTASGCEDTLAVFADGACFRSFQFQPSVEVSRAVAEAGCASWRGSLEDGSTAGLASILSAPQNQAATATLSTGRQAWLPMSVEWSNNDTGIPTWSAAALLLQSDASLPALNFSSWAVGAGIGRIGTTTCALIDGDGSWGPAACDATLNGYVCGVASPPVDECSLGTHNCGQGSACQDTRFAWECVCTLGFSGNPFSDVVATDLAKGAVITTNFPSLAIARARLGYASAAPDDWPNRPHVQLPGVVCDAPSSWAEVTVDARAVHPIYNILLVMHHIAPDGGRVHCGKTVEVSPTGRFEGEETLVFACGAGADAPCAPETSPEGLVVDVDAIPARFVRFRVAAALSPDPWVRFLKTSVTGPSFSTAGCARCPVGTTATAPQVCQACALGSEDLECVAEESCDAGEGLARSGKCFRTFHEARSSAGAGVACAAWGGVLARVESMDQQDATRRLVRDMTWMGFEGNVALGSTAMWDHLGFERWASTSTEGGSPPSNTSEACAVMAVGGRWHARDCTVQAPSFLCARDFNHTSANAYVDQTRSNAPLPFYGSEG